MKAALASNGQCGMAESRHSQGGLPWAVHHRLRMHAIFWGMIAAAFLFGLYVALVGWANSWQHALTEFTRLWYWMAPLVAGFGLQVGLYDYARGAARSGAHPHGSPIMASGGASTLSMAACCAHHLADVLPIIGLSGAGLFLSTYQELFLLVGIMSNALGILYLLSVIGRHRLAPSQGSMLSLLPAHAWRPVFVSGGIASAITLVVGVWAFVL